MSYPLAAHLPRWLSDRLTTEIFLPGQSYTMQAAVLYADLVGFTALTEAMAQRGSQGVEALGQVLNTVFGALVETVYAYGGDVLNFSGDALTAFWSLSQSDSGLPSGAAALTIQAVMQRFNQVDTPAGPMPLALRVGLASGSLTLMVVGDAMQQRFVASGPALENAVEAEKIAPHGQIVLHASARGRMGAAVECDAAGCLLQLLQTYVSAAPPASLADVPLEQLRPFVHPVLIERMETGQEKFLADLRRDVVSVFASFAAATATAIQAYVVQAMVVIEQHGGYLLEVEVGDKGNVLVILFGAPLSSGDHSQRAAACALDLAALPGALGLGATTGLVFAGVVGSRCRCQYTVFGDEMNLAARLMQASQDLRGPAALPDAMSPILLDARVSKQAGERFVYGERQWLSVKGKVEPIAVVRLLERAQHWGDWIRPWLSKGRAIGRLAELAQLDEYMTPVMAGHGQLLTLVGEAGIGKSCLAGELLRRWFARGGEAYVGAALSTQHTPYSAWGELLRAVFDLRGDGFDVARVEAGLAAINSELVCRLPLLSDVMDLGLPDNDLTHHFDARLRQQSTQALIVELVRAWAGRRPLLLMLEDAHWLDQASWELMLSVARVISDLPICLCLVHRPLVDPPAAYLALTGLAHHVSLTLGELTPDEAVALACARLEAAALPDELVTLVQSKAQGHPFFVEEIVNALRDSGVVAVEGQQVVIQCELAQVELPDTVQGLVQARLDRLDEPTRLTLKVASVIGHTFSSRILQAVHPARLSGEHLAAQLSALQALDIMPLEQAEPDSVYIFKHSITQEVAYQTMTFAQRRELHRLVAEWYEREPRGQGGALSPSLLAHHYHCAGDAGRERHYARLAGEQAAAQFANAVAVRYLSRALELTPENDHSARYDLLLARERVYDLLGQRSLELQDLQTLQALVGRLGPLTPITLCLRQANYAQVTGDYPAAIAAAEQAIALARAAGQLALQAQGHFEWARVLSLQGNYEAARQQSHAALSLARSAGLSRIEADSLRTLGLIGVYQGARVDAEDHLRQALAIYSALGDRQGEGRTLNTWGENYLTQGDSIKGREYFTRALRVAQEIGDRQGEQWILCGLGESARYLGDYAGARAWYERSLRIGREVDDRRGQGIILSNLGLVLHNLGDDQAAWDYGQQGWYRASTTGDQRSLGFCEIILGHIQAGLGRWPEALTYYQQVLDRYRELGDRNLVWDALSGLAHVTLAQGNPAGALAYVEEILVYLQAGGAFEGSDEPFRIYLTCYQVLLANADPRAPDILDKAYQRLQARAAQIPDEATRRAFLENTRAHCELLAAWSQYEGQLPPALPGEERPD